MTDVEFPEMRHEVRHAVESLADRAHQERVWIRHDLPQPDYYDEFKLEIHILFDDTDVCVDPEASVGKVLHPDEVEPFRVLGAALDDLLSDPRLVADADYLADPRWDVVITLAGAARDTMARRT